tara:strand:- start:15 stop:791 length:777 start_codon:yes stop_codon:yes gene_type:complete
MYQATVYQYNQRAETLIPQRRGTSYYGPDNHKPLIAYKGLNVEFDFFVKDTDRKPQSLDNKTYTATVLDRTSKASVLTKTLIPTDYSEGKLVLKLDHEETLLLDAKLYDLVVTYTVTDVAGSYGGSSDQNNRITFVLEIKDGAVSELRPSETVTTFNPIGDDRFSGRLTGPVLNNSKTGLNTIQVHYTDYTGVYKIQATLSLNPTDSDFFDVTAQTYTIASATAVDYHTFIGNYTFVRLKHTPAVGNTGTLDKVVYRS